MSNNYLSNKNKRFLSRICVRLYNNPQRWIQLMEEQGMDLDEVTTYLVNETQTQKEQKHETITIIPTKSETPD